MRILRRGFKRHPAPICLAAGASQIRRARSAHSSSSEKQKTAAAPASNNPDWSKTITLTPITDLEEDLRIQVYERRIFAEDEQLGKTLKIPLRELIDNAAVEKWYDIEPTDDKPLHEGEKSARVKLSLELHGVKAPED